jgi:hypothetical protein
MTFAREVSKKGRTGPCRLVSRQFQLLGPNGKTERKRGGRLRRLMLPEGALSPIQVLIMLTVNSGK